jgi:hypothetical protein
MQTMDDVGSFTIESIVKVEQSKHELITHSTAIVAHDASFTPFYFLPYSN